MFVISQGIRRTQATIHTLIFSYIVIIKMLLLVARSMIISSDAGAFSVRFNFQRCNTAAFHGFCK